ncbi:MAG: prepilin-type N-terminal cleavage/methylation domain-containing protein [Candidatus Omnitrophica bacterium]|nr:prepilin-type N-terminal cleavage/methylation domain-containing protein [Candidatus Omnitrophota bacterium]MBU4457751.1 prepilin-type N-terminal cleavage/methylation domain-containing protein [Candidatus Omnitrophota bacterium]
MFVITRRGFTLLEVLIVVIIIGILAAIALPQYIKTIEKARSAEAVTNIGYIRTSLDRYWYENDYSFAGVTLPTDGSQCTLDIDNPNAVKNKLYDTYSISGFSAPPAGRAYTILATRTAPSGTIYTVEWVQESNVKGTLYRSANLGGPVKP